jgi:hypothetical protein
LLIGTFRDRKPGLVFQIESQGDACVTLVERLKAKPTASSIRISSLVSMGRKKVSLLRWRQECRNPGIWPKKL